MASFNVYSRHWLVLRRIFSGRFLHQQGDFHVDTNDRFDSADGHSWFSESNQLWTTKWGNAIRSKTQLFVSSIYTTKICPLRMPSICCRTVSRRKSAYFSSVRLLVKELFFVAWSLAWMMALTHSAEFSAFDGPSLRLALNAIRSCCKSSFVWMEF